MGILLYFMNIFFDTEFTGFHQDTSLISIGLIDEDGRSFYAEFTDYDLSYCDDWIRCNIISNLIFKGNHSDLCNTIIDGNSVQVIGKSKYIKLKLVEWLSHYDSIQLISDCCHYDMVLFIHLFGNDFRLPININHVCHDINQDIASYYHISEFEAFDKSREGILNDFGISFSIDSKHNSLHDALVIKKIYEFIC